jgi:hypothetical protein
MPWVVVNDPEAGKRLMSRLLQRPRILARLTVLPEEEHRIAISGLVTMSWVMVHASDVTLQL